MVETVPPPAKNKIQLTVPVTVFSLSIILWNHSMSETGAVFFIRWGKVRSPSISCLFEELILHPAFKTICASLSNQTIYSLRSAISQGQTKWDSVAYAVIWEMETMETVQF